MKQGVFYINIFLLSAAICFATPSFGAAPVSSQQIETLEQKSDLKKMEYKRLQAEAVALSIELAKMNKELVEAAKRVQKDEDKIMQTEKELALIQNKLKIAEEKFKKEHRNLELMLVSLQNLALHPTDSLLFQPLTPVEIIQSAILMRSSIGFLSQNSQSLKADLEDLNAQHKDLNQKLLELSSQTQNLKKKQESIKQIALKKNQIRTTLEGESSKARKEALELASKASDLRDLMEKAIRQAELKRQKQEELKRAAREREMAAQRKLEQEQQLRLQKLREQAQSQSADTPLDDSSFEDEKAYDTVKAQDVSDSTPKPSAGQFLRPARGEIVTFYGQELSKGVNSKGIIIQTRANAQVVAPYDGTVLFSGPFKGYGHLVIISHGDDLVSLIAGMQNNDTENAQMVLAGEPIGLMPDTAQPKLYMEIRKNKKPINPIVWLGQ